MIPPLLLLLLACKPPETPSSEEQQWSVGHAHDRLDDRPERTLPVEVWFPTDAPLASATTTPIMDAYLSDEDERATYTSLLAAAPVGCPTTETLARRDAPLAAGIWPVVVLSHCHNCVRFSNLRIAEGLAAAGFVVVAPDHIENTLFDPSLPLDPETLRLRQSDLERTLDALLDGRLGLDPTQLRGDAVGALGHSFGSLTVGQLALENPRIRAVMGVAAPMVADGDSTALEVPLLFLLAGEDNSITELGNGLIRLNYEQASGPAWKVEVADAGHWSFSDVCGLTEDFLPGCGTAPRQTDPDQTVSYPPPDTLRALGADLAVAFFQETLRGQEGALDTLREQEDGIAWSLDQKDR